MSDWAWEYLPAAEAIAGGLGRDPQIKRDVERLGRRLADAPGGS
ncbi:hypothetical protein [Streptomyces milbemycinicus]